MKINYYSKNSFQSIILSKNILSRLHANKCSCRQPAFTLPELLIGGSIGALLIIIGASIAVENATATNKLLTLQSLRSNWTRVTLLMNTDGAEACLISKSSSSISFRIPSSSSGSCSASDPLITYNVTSSGVLKREGPLINRNGTLNLVAANQSSTVQESVSLDTSCSSTFNSCYKLTLAKNGLSYSGDGLQSAGNRARVRSF